MIHVLRAVAAAGLLLTACGGDAKTTEAGNAIEPSNTIEAMGSDRLAFEPDEFTIPAGEEVAVELTADSVEHDFVVEGAAKHGVAEAAHQADDPDDLHVAHADPGGTVTAELTIDKAGTYTVYCSVPGHRDAGMVATLEVIVASEG